MISLVRSNDTHEVIIIFGNQNNLEYSFLTFFNLIPCCSNNRLDSWLNQDA